MVGVEASREEEVHGVTPGHRATPGKMVRGGRGERLQAQKDAQAYPAAHAHTLSVDDTTRVAQHDVRWADANMCDMMVSQVYATDGVDAPGRQQSAAACSSACRHDGASASSWPRNTEEEEQHEGEQPEQRQELPPQLQHQRRARHAAPSHTEQAAGLIQQRARCPSRSRLIPKPEHTAKRLGGGETPR